MREMNLLALWTDALTWQRQALMSATLIAARFRRFAFWHTHSSWPLMTTQESSSVSEWQRESPYLRPDTYTAARSG